MNQPAENNACAARNHLDGQRGPSRLHEGDGRLETPGDVDPRQIEWVACVAHEMRNPLGAIRTAAALLGLPGPEAQERSRRIIERQTDHLMRMIDDLLELARGRLGQARFEPVAVDLSEIVAEVLEARTPQLQGRRQTVQAAGIDEPAPMRGDPMQLAQVIGNLLDNAAKFSAAGQVVRLSLSRRHDQVELAVADDGVGIEAAALARVFEPFEHGVQGAGATHAGLGIGLAIVRKLSELHGGTVVAESAGAGLGSRFVVTLPTGLEPGRPSGADKPA